MNFFKGVLSSSRLMSVAVLLLAILPSCLKDFENIKEIQIKGDWEPDITVPLIASRFDVTDFIKELGATMGQLQNTGAMTGNSYKT